jgi:hypothetical protein
MEILLSLTPKPRFKEQINFYIEPKSNVTAEASAMSISFESVVLNENVSLESQPFTVLQGLLQ